MSSEKVNRVIETLLDDHYRQGLLRLDDVVRAIEKRGLDSEEIIEVQRALANHQIEIVTDAEDTSAYTGKPQAQSESADLLGLYLREITIHKLLRADEEVTLARRMRTGERAAAISAQDRNTPPHVKQLTEEGERARERLILSNLRLVVKIARRFTRRSKLEFLDLIQEGTFGLMEAVRRFDPEKGYKLSTYATWWIAQRSSRAVDNFGRTIRLPVHICQDIRTLEKLKFVLRTRTGAEPSTQDLSEVTGLTPKKIRLLEGLSREPIPLDAPISNDEDDPLGSVIVSHSGSNPEEEYSKRELMRVLLSGTQTLTEKQRNVLNLRYGLEDGRERTLEEIGQQFGVTRERIRQIEVKAIQRLQKRFGSSSARKFYGFPQEDKHQKC